MTKRYGDTWRYQCPICDEALPTTGDAAAPVVQEWRIPFSQIETVTVAGGYFNMLPMLRDDAVLYGFSICPKCASIFVNPCDSGAAPAYSAAAYPTERVTDPTKMAGHKAQYENFIRALLLERPGGRMLDAGCGIGQYLFLAAEDAAANVSELIGLELSKQAVEAINEIAAQRGLAGRLTAHECNLCLLGANEAMRTRLGLFDVIVLSETFEHLDHPGATLATLAQMLCPGGAIFYTAQAPDGGMAVRPTEPIYMSRVGQDILVEKTGLKLIRTGLVAGRWKTVLSR